MSHESCRDAAAELRYSLELARETADSYAKEATELQAERDASIARAERAEQAVRVLREALIGLTVAADQAVRLNLLPRVAQNDLFTACAKGDHALAQTANVAQSNNYSSMPKPPARRGMTLDEWLVYAEERRVDAMFDREDIDRALEVIRSLKAALEEIAAGDEIIPTCLQRIARAALQLEMKP